MNLLGRQSGNVKSTSATTDLLSCKKRFSSRQLDELFLKVKGSMKYLYAMMDEQTRFWIAQEVADTKYTADVRPQIIRC
jgi:transposase-like protein